MIGDAFSIDETTMCFKGHHTEEIRMTYKVEGDGLHKYAICQKLYAYKIFMCNDTAT